MLIVCILSFNVLYLLYDKEENLFVSGELNDSSSGMFAILVEDGNGSYSEYDGEDWPTDGYEYNSEKSYCVNGTELIWDD